MFSASRVKASGQVAGECGVQCSWTEPVRDRRNSNRCDSETLVVSHVSGEVGWNRQRQCNTVGYARTNVIGSRTSFVIGSVPSSMH